MIENNIQVSKEHYCHGYDHKARWLSYYYQSKTVLKLGVVSVLEIGPGNGTVSDYLRKQGIALTTVDIDPELKPDITASLLKIPLPDNSFDLVMACEVLEHLPFEKFIPALKEISRVSKHYIFISLPDHRRTLFYFRMKIPLLSEIAFRIRIPAFTRHVFNGQHYWEIGKVGFSPRIIRKAIIRSGLRIVKDLVRHDAPMNHFFLMEKGK
jgi:SAM-dependent methyltransferase